MKRVSKRKFFLFGKYSLALLLPKKWLTEFQIESGDVREIELDRKRGKIIVNLGEGEPARPADRKEDEPDLKTDGFSPIPPLK